VSRVAETPGSAIRDSSAFVSWQDREAILPPVEAIYRAEHADMAMVRHPCRHRRLLERETHSSCAFRPVPIDLGHC
jgi:hypothetical protein